MRTHFSRFRQPRIASKWLPLLYPQLKHLPYEQWPELLRRARQTELSRAERVGIVAAVGTSAYLLQPLVDSGAGFVVRYLAQFALALPVVAILAAPWLVRRTRRGLESEAGRSNGGDPCSESQAQTPAHGISGGRSEQQRTVAPRRSW